MLESLQPGDPEQVGPYRLLGVLGSGGFGRVFLGRSADARLAAVKVIRPELAANPEFRVRFRREVAAAGKVSGRFTARVLDADAEGPVPWLATAYVSGPSLGEAVAKYGPLPDGSVLALAAGLAEALAAIHAAGLVHRDLKPENVLLAEDGPRVIDFGIARPAGASTLTGTGVLIGTFAFMSPEQVLGNEVGPPSDVFSLGSVLVFAATGQGPYGSGPTAQLIYRLAHEAPSLDQVPHGVRPLVQRCMAAEPWRRPTIDALLADLRTAVPAAGWLPGSVTRDVRAEGRLSTERLVAVPPRMGPEPAALSTARHRIGSTEFAQRPSRASMAVLKVGAVVAAAVAAVALVAVYAAGHFTSHDSALGAVPPASAPARPSPTHASLARSRKPSRVPSSSAPLSSAGWSAGQQIDTGDGFVSVSCASASFCMAADSGGNIYTYAHGTWSQPQQLDGSGLTSVSCPTAGFCVAASNNDDIYTYSGGAWSSPSQLMGADGNPANLTSVSCPAAGTCMATGDWDSYTYSGGRWEQGHLIQDTNTFASVSCASASFCMAADSAGNIYTYSAG